MTHFDIEVTGFAALRGSHFPYAGLTRYDASPGQGQGNEAALKSGWQNDKGGTP
jgi:hypothetical protein